VSSSLAPDSPPDTAGLPGELSVTALVCAHTMERWDDIVRGIEGLRAQTRPAAEILLVIDHNPDLFARATEEFADVIVIDNPNESGTSGARNAGITRATGDVIAFLDDDARPEVDWLERLVEAFDAPEVMVVGGWAHPVWPERRPAHMPPELDWLVGCSYLGQPTARTDVRNPFGCNMSMRREVFDIVGLFDEKTGRKGNTPLGGEETLLCIRLGQHRPESRVVMEPRAVVHHRVSDDRLEWSYLRRRGYAEGLSKAAIAQQVGGSVNATGEERGYVRRVLPRGLRRELGRGLRGQRDGWSGAAGIVTTLCMTALGFARGRLRIRLASLRAGR
jgi:GT2 family glycosyltransferase